MVSMKTVAIYLTLLYSLFGGYDMAKIRLDHDRIIKLYRSGLSLEIVAEKAGCSKAGVYNVLTQHKVKLRVGAKRGDVARKLGFKPTKKWLRGLMKEHPTAADAARSVGLNYQTFVTLLHKHGVPRQTWRGGPGPAGNPRRQEIPIKEAIKLSNEGIPYRVLAEKYSVSPGVVMRRMKEVGHVAPKNKQKRYAEFQSVSLSKKRVLNNLGITVCQVCGESRALDYCHIVPASEGGPVAEDNCLVLCPTHHRLFDNDSLAPDERRMIARKINAAKRRYL